VRVVNNPAVRGKYVGLHYAKRLNLWGALGLLCGVAFVAYDLTRDLTWIWGYLIGLKLTVTGGFCLGQGLLGWYEHRGES
jgi:hypothetical protein